MEEWEGRGKVFHGDPEDLVSKFGDGQENYYRTDITHSSLSFSLLVKKLKASGIDKIVSSPE